jgi:hypothetical protein
MSAFPNPTHPVPSLSRVNADETEQQEAKKAKIDPKLIEAQERIKVWRVGKPRQCHKF